MTCNVGLRAGNQFHLFSNFEKNMFNFTDTYLLSDMVCLCYNESLSIKKLFRTKYRPPQERKIQYRFSRVKCHVACGTGMSHVLQLNFCEGTL